jgi:hypothetical protein
MARIAGKDGVYSLKGFSKWLYERDVPGWRDRTVLKFEGDDVVKVTVDNEHGSFLFQKDEELWTGKFKKTDGAALAPIENFKEGKIKSFIAAYKNLNATDFAQGKSLEETGLDKPVATVTIEEKEGKATHVLMVGGTAEGTNRWVKRNGSDDIFSISSWSADWATNGVDKYTQEAKDEAAAASGAPPGAHDVMPAAAPGE